MSKEKPTSIDLILADTDAEGIILENKLGVTQQEMPDFFYARFFLSGQSGAVVENKARLRWMLERTSANLSNLLIMSRLLIDETS